MPGWCPFPFGQNRWGSHKQDGPWSWLVLVCTTFQSWLIIGLARSYGVFLPVFMKEFKEGRDKIALIGSLTLGGSFFLTVFTSWLNSFIPNRVVCGMGHVSLIVAYSLSSNIHRLEPMYFTFSIVGAIGMSFTLSTHVLILVKYFKRHRSLAQGINGAGGALGVMTVPIIMQYSLDTLGWRNTFRLLSGCVALSIFVCIIFSPNVSPEMHESHGNTAENSNESHKTNNDTSNQQKLSGASKYLDVTPDSDVKNAECDNHAKKHSTHPNAAGQENLIEHGISKNTAEQEKQTLKNRLENINNRKTVKGERIQKGITNENGILNSLKAMFDLSVWKNPKYVLAVISICICSFAMFSPAIHLVKFAEDIVGLSATKASTLYMFLGIASLIARVTAGKLCDISCIQPSFVNMAAELLAVTTTFLLTLSTSYVHLAVLMFLHGLAEGMFRTTSVVLMTTTVDRLKSGTAFGQGYFCVAPFFIAGPAITGLLADVFGGYTNAYYLNGCVLFGGAAVHLIPMFLKLSSTSRDFTLEEIEMSPVHGNFNTSYRQDATQTSHTNPSYLEDDV